MAGSSARQIVAGSLRMRWRPLPDLQSFALTKLGSSAIIDSTNEKSGALENHIGFRLAHLQIQRWLQRPTHDVRLRRNRLPLSQSVDPDWLATKANPPLC